MAKQEKEQKEVWSVVEVATQTSNVLKNNYEGKIYGNEEILAKILNKLETIESLIKVPE